MTATRRPPSAEQLAGDVLLRSLHTLSYVERGMARIDALRALVDPNVIAGWEPMKPLNPGQPIAPVQVKLAVVRVHDDGCRAHASAIAQRPECRTSGYVAELARASTLRRFQVVELTTVEERALVGVVRRPEYGEHLPERIDGLIGAASQAHAAAIQQLRRAIAQVEELDRLIFGQRRPPQALKDERRRVAATVTRWRARVNGLAEELDVYREAHRDRLARSQAAHEDAAARSAAARRLAAPTPEAGIDPAEDDRGVDLGR